MTIPREDWVACTCEHVLAAHGYDGCSLPGCTCTGNVQVASD